MSEFCEWREVAQRNKDCPCFSPKENSVSVKESRYRKEKFPGKIFQVINPYVTSKFLSSFRNLC